MATKLGRVALQVADVDTAVTDFEKLFGLQFKVFEVAAQGLRVAIGDHGLELVQALAGGEVPPSGSMMGACLAVDDVEATRDHLASLGRLPVMTIPLQSGRKEYVFEPVHGIPVMIYQECGFFDEVAQ